MAAMKPNLDELAVGAKSGLPWSAYDCTRNRLRQFKTGVRVSIAVEAPLKATLDSAARRGPIVLTSAD
jgi:hypothetical protein